MTMKQRVHLKHVFSTHNQQGHANNTGLVNTSGSNALNNVVTAWSSTSMCMCSVCMRGDVRT